MDELVVGERYRRLELSPSSQPIQGESLPVSEDELGTVVVQVVLGWPEARGGLNHLDDRPAVGRREERGGRLGSFESESVRSSA